MNTTLVPNDDGTHNLYVNGHLVLSHESYQVCSNVEDALLDPSDWYSTECGEMADSIRRRYV